MRVYGVRKTVRNIVKMVRRVQWKKGASLDAVEEELSREWKHYR
jgi:hypothetical protein